MAFPYPLENGTRSFNTFWKKIKAANKTTYETTAQ